MKRVTLREVAKAAGVSTMTVSYALRNHPKISAARRESIRKLAESMGYRSDPQIQAAMSRVRSAHPTDGMPVALLNVGVRREKLHETPYYRALVDAARERFDALGFKLDEFWLRAKGMRADRMADIILNRGIHGIFFPAHVDPDETLDFNWQNFFTIASTLQGPNEAVHRVAPYNSRNVMIALKALWERGYRRIGLAGSGQMQRMFGYQYSAYYRSFYWDHQGREPFPVYETPTKGPPPRDILKWIEGQKLDAVLAMEHWIGRHLQNEHGVKFPEDIGFATLDLGSEEMAGIDQRPEHIGVTAADMLTAALQRNETGLPEFRKTTLIEGTWVDGKTVQQFTL